MPTDSFINYPNNAVILDVHVAQQQKPVEYGKKLILLTGMMGSGKSTLGRLLSAFESVLVIDADKVAKDVVYNVYLAKNVPKLTRIFGEEIFVRNDANRIESVDLRKIASLFFSKQELQAQFALAFGEQIMWAVGGTIATAQSHGLRYVIVENAVAIEKGWLTKFKWNHVICTVCSEENQLARLMKRPGTTEDEHRARMRTHFPVSKKLESASIIVITNGNEDELPLCAEAVFTMLSKM